MKSWVMSAAKCRNPIIPFARALVVAGLLFCGISVLAEPDAPLPPLPDEAWFYYGSAIWPAGLEPVTAENEAAEPSETALPMALVRMTGLAAPMSLDETFGLLDAGSGCVTGGPFYITNVICSLDADLGWTVNFDIAGGTNDVPVDIFSATDLVSDSITNSVWVWLGQGYTCNTYQFTNQPDAQAFYILGTPQDTDGDGLTDAYERLVSKTDPAVFSLVSSDGQGTPDAWYLQQGLNPLVPGIAGLDSNQDGLPNWQKYLFGANPQAAPVFEVWVSEPKEFSSLP